MWQIMGSVPIFAPYNDLYWGEMDRNRFLEFLDASRKEGWRSAAIKLIKEKDEVLYEYLFGYSRSSWQYFLPVTRKSIILDAGAGLGIHSFNLANQCREVHALESVKERAFFIQMRKEQDGVKNLFPACGSLLSLPYPDNFFDIAILNNVLEWVPLSDKKEDPEKVQLRALKNINRVLKPGGIMYLAIENRFSIIYFAGFKDPHSGLKYVNIVPRFAANFISLRKRNEPYRTYIHSFKKYKKMLKDTGFDKNEFFAPLPSSRNYFYFIPLSDYKIVRFYLKYMYDLKNLSLIKVMHKFLRFLPMEKLFPKVVPDFSIFAKKSEII